MEFALLDLDLFQSHKNFFVFQFIPLGMEISILFLSYHYSLETGNWFPWATDREEFCSRIDHPQKVLPKPNLNDLEDNIWDFLS